MDKRDEIKDIWQFFPIPLAYLNPTGTILNLSDTLAELLGQSREELLGARLFDFIEEDEMEKIQQELINQGLAKNREIYIKTQQKEEMPVSISILARKDKKGIILGYLLSLSDLSQIKKKHRNLEDKIAELQEFCSLAIDRELRMIELEKEVNSLLVELGRELKYKEKE